MYVSHKFIIRENAVLHDGRRARQMLDRLLVCFFDSFWLFFDVVVVVVISHINHLPKTLVFTFNTLFVLDGVFFSSLTCITYILKKKVESFMGGKMKST